MVQQQTGAGTPEGSPWAWFRETGRSLETGTSCFLWENISCHINKQEMSQPSLISSLQMWMWAPQPAIWQMLPPTTVIAEELGDYKKVNKETGLAPDSWGAYERNEFSYPRGLPSSHTQNAIFLNLILDLWCSDCLLPLLQTCCKPDFPTASLESFSQSYRDAVSQAPSPKQSHQIK